MSADLPPPSPRRIRSSPRLCSLSWLPLLAALSLTPRGLRGVEPARAEPATAPAVSTADEAPRPLPRRLSGFAMSPYFERPSEGLRFLELIDELAETGARDISLTVHWSQQNISSTEIAPDPRETRSDALILSLMRRARARGLRVMLFPILWLQEQAIGAWRGTIRPSDEARWWASYRRFIFHYAQLAARGGAQLFSVGSELSSMEGREQRWRQLIAEVRERFSGELIYSANWDHYHEVTFWSALDRIGFTGYYILSEHAQPTLSQLRARWEGIRQRIEAWPGRGGRPVVFTEVGYPSIDGASMRPWDYTGDRPVDLEEQRLCFEAFRQVWSQSPILDGVYFWNWWGPGGPNDRWYTLRGKPALATVQRFLNEFQSE